MNPSYVIDQPAVATAHDQINDRIARAQERLARVMCAALAASVRDILTDHHPDPAAPFDAAYLRLNLYPSSQRVGTDGTYWTGAGERRQLDMLDLFDLIQLTRALNGDNLPGWEPLCVREERARHDLTSYRLDLAQAAALPAEFQNTDRVTAIRNRLASTSRPWRTEEFVYDANGQFVDEDNPTAVHTDILIHDATGNHVAELSLNHGPNDTDNPADALAATRANADLITHAPQDLLTLLTHLDHLYAGRDAEVPHTLHT
ncbi:hypothetical protein [Streptomyces microflavus]|uniref:hypothetical protein n=1 Tax=Streptomyces microflavus TaxID=1919 RepID=UPI0036494357